MISAVKHSLAGLFYNSKDQTINSKDDIDEEITISDLYAKNIDKIVEKLSQLDITYVQHNKTLHLHGLKYSIKQFKEYLHDMKATIKFALYPKYWDFGDPRRYCEINVSPDSQEFIEVAEKFRNTSAGFKIIHLIKIQNHDLMDIYIDSLTKAQEKRPIESEHRKLLYHGTRTVDPTELYSVNKVGFDLKHARPGTYGKGIYFAERAEYSCCSFNHTLPNGNQQILLADVFVGKPHDRPNHDGSELSPDYDSVYAKNADFYVLYRNHHCYPLYLIEYAYDTGKINLNTRFEDEKIGRQKPPPRVCKLIQQELNEITSDPAFEDFSIVLPIEDDVTEWVVSVFGPFDTCYEGGLFNIKISFYGNYPLEAPVVKFDTKICHPCINSSGSVCLGILHKWRPGANVMQILLTLYLLLVDPSLEDAIVPEIADLFQNDYKAFRRKACEWTQRYAT